MTNFHYDFDRKIEKEFASGQCRAYQTAPLVNLREPGYGEDCYYIYLSRKYDSTVPYTLESYNSDRAASHEVNTSRH